VASLSRSTFLTAAGAAALAAAVPLRARSAERIGVDYAYYNPPSLVLKSKGWLEEALGKRGTSVDWVLSLGSNKANGFLAAGAVQFGSTAGSAALLARANGTPIKTVFLYSRPEWTAIVVPKDSPVKSVRDLRGKRVAATRGTDPWFFLLRSLAAAGLQPTDVQLVDLQHPDGRTALERGQVDAWAGLDPHMAASQLDAGSRLLYRNVAFNTFGALNAREDFLAQHADVAAIVINAYDRARKYAAAHVEETAALLSDASHVERRVADLQLRERTTYPGNGTPGSDYHDAIAAVVPLIRNDKLAKPDADLDGALASLIDARVAATALRG
jgi:sulfonate transport system substrate-binding protein